VTLMPANVLVLWPRVYSARCLAKKKFASGSRVSAQWFLLGDARSV
jgi:hypothetical protein